MAMSLDELKVILDRKCEGGQFKLPVSLLKSDSAAKVSRDFLPGNEICLDLSDPEKCVQKVGQTLIVSGKGLDLPFKKKMHTEAKFYLNAGEPAFQIIGTGDPDWNLGVGFPPFKGTLAANLRFSTAKVILYSHDEPGNEGAGMYFEGELDLSRMSAGLFDALGLPAKMQKKSISGPVVLKENGSKLYGIDLLAQDINGVSLGIANDVKLAFGVRSRLGYNRRRNSYFIFPYIVLGANISFSAQQNTHSIPVSVQVTNFTSDIRFSADLTEGIDAAVDEIGGLLKQAGLGDLLPKGNCQIENILRLKEFFFDFSPAAQNKISLIGARVQSTSSWRVLHLDKSNRDLKIENFSLVFQVFDPFVEKPISDRVMVYVSGDIVLGKAGEHPAGENPPALAITASYPNWRIQGNLKQGTRLNLTEILKEFLGSAVNVPTMEVAGLSFELYSGNYALEADLKGYWPIPLGQFELAIEEVAFSVTHSAGSGTSGWAEGVFGIAGVDIRVKAAHPSGAAAGWEFSGSTGPGQQIHIETWIGDLAELFGQDIKEKLPPPIKDLTIEDLGITFNTKTKDFSFTCKAQFPIDSSAKVAITVTIELTHQNGGYKKEFGGHIQFNVASLPAPLDFHLKFVSEKTQDKPLDLFVATYSHTGAEQKLKVGELIRGVLQQNTLPDWTQALDTVEIDLKSALFAFSSEGKKILFGLDIGTKISLGQLPVVGKTFPERTVGIDDLQVLIAFMEFNLAETKKINELIETGVTRLPEVAQSGGAQGGSQDDTKIIALKQGLNVSATLNLGDTTRSVSLPAAASGSSSGSSRTTGDTTTQPASTGSNAKWFKIQKSLGPVYFERVGLQYQDAKVWVLLDAALSGAGLTLSLDGLAFKSPLKPFAPEFDLQGLGMAFKRGDLEIGGALLKRPAPAINAFDGALVLRYKRLAIEAVGSYETIEGRPSLFLYALIDYPLGGPAFFYVEGGAVGFGYNRTFTTPTIEKVAEFPLVKQALGQSKLTLTELVNQLQEYVKPTVGEYFLAAGVKFTSFKTIKGFVLLTILFGEHVEIDLLGKATLTSPAGVESGKALMSATLLFLGRFLPKEGFLMVMAQLAPDARLFAPDCHLSGGFAWYCWFDGKHKGDFALTLGGYHKSFLVPDHYPRVPRLAMNWQVNSNLSLKAEAYFALTPSALMAGGKLEINWHSGNLQAWLRAEIDFLMGWQPFYYNGHAYVALGVRYCFEFFGRQEISAELTAQLDLWGPEFSGRARVQWNLLAFEVSFGPNNEPRPPDALKWLDFRKAFLPKHGEPMFTVTAEAGKVAQGTASAAGVNTASGTKGANLGCLNPRNLCITVRSPLPIKEPKENDTRNNLLKNAKDLRTDITEPKLGIAPMNKKAAEWKESLVKITIFRTDVHPKENKSDLFRATRIRNNVPASLWGEKMDPNDRRDDPPLLKDATCGYELCLSSPVEPTTLEDPTLRPTPPVVRQMDPRGVGWLINNLIEKENFSEAARDIEARLRDDAVRKKRNQILNDLLPQTLVDWTTIASWRGKPGIVKSST